MSNSWGNHSPQLQRPIHAPARTLVFLAASIYFVACHPALGSDSFTTYREQWRICCQSVLSPDGSLVAHGLSALNGSDPGAIFVSRLEKAGTPIKLAIAEAEPKYLAISADNKVLAAVTWNHLGLPVEKWEVHLRCWKLAGGEQFFDFRIAAKQKFGSLRFSADGARILMLDGDAVRIFDIAKRDFVDSFDCKNIRNWQIDVSPDGKLIAIPDVGSDAVRLFDAKTYKPQTSLTVRGHQPATECKFSPDGHWLAARDDHQLVYVWDLVRTEAEPVVVSHRSPDPLVFSPDSKTLALVQNNFVVVYDLAANERIRRSRLSDQVGDMVFPRFGSDSKKMWVSGYYPETHLFEVPE